MEIAVSVGNSLRPSPSAETAESDGCRQRLRPAIFSD